MKYAGILALLVLILVLAISWANLTSNAMPTEDVKPLFIRDYNKRVWKIYPSVNIELTQEDKQTLCRLVNGMMSKRVLDKEWLAFAPFPIDSVTVF